MPYLEPRCNQFDVEPPAELLPDLSRVNRAEILKLCKVWDNQDLLRLYPAHFTPGVCPRCSTTTRILHQIAKLETGEE